MASLRDDLQQALNCLQFVNEDDDHDVEHCVWCQCSEYISAFDGDAAVNPAVDLLKRALAAVEQQQNNEGE